MRLNVGLWYGWVPTGNVLGRRLRRLLASIFGHMTQLGVASPCSCSFHVCFPAPAGVKKFTYHVCVWLLLAYYL